MILGKQAILNEIEAGNILVSPFNPDFVGTNSIDVRWSDEWYRLEIANTNRVGSDFGFIDPYSDSETQFRRIVWNSDLEGPFTILLPGVYLTRTVESIGTRDGSGLLPDLDSKSTIARWGLTTSVCAGRGDVGFANAWGLSVRVSVPTLVRPFTVCSQVRFTRVECDTTEAAYGGQGSYDPALGVVRFLPKPLKVHHGHIGSQ